METICNGWYWLNGRKQCNLLNSTGCRMTGNIKCGLYELTLPLLGWECPRCHKINSPFIFTCNCPIPTIDASIQI